MRRLFVTLCLMLPASFVCAQQPVKPDTPSPAIRQFQQLEDRWSDAVTKRDQYGMELVLAPQFIGISASGDVTTRNQQIAHLFVKNGGPESLEQKVVTVRLVGDVAIVNGTYVLTWKGEKGPVLEKGIFSHVFEHVRTNWMCLNSQRTVVAEQTSNPGGKDKPKVKHSDAESPFHIPFIYKGPDSNKPAPAQNASAPAQ
ncbi:MAG TPA: nuclear transport factor 2 family protein [Acidobacteriaceae bacterium]|nr:nuclear transport factor 2 family protein [Acidobacteriaceae bacterium]